MKSTFKLHPQLEADTVMVGVLPLCEVRLMNDRNFPWCILVPIRDGIREIHELDEAGQQQLVGEISGISRAMQAAFAADKMNVAALGNVVPQLHIHVIARFRDDPAWPGPVWGRQMPLPYEKLAEKQQLEKIRRAFHPIPGFRTDL